MKKSRYSNERIIGVLKQAEAGVKVAERVRKHGISEARTHESICQVVDLLTVVP